MFSSPLLHSLAGVAALGILLTACSDTVTAPDTPPRALTKTETEVVGRANTFGLGLFARMSADAPSTNVFISPFSVSMALGMTLNGAGGDTRTAMQGTLGFEGMSDSAINTSYRGIIDLLRTLDPKVRFDIANSIWTRQGFPVLPAFLATNRSYFDAECAELDFSQPSAVSAINAWVKTKTNGKIPTILDDPIADDIVMYLVNAIYFKGTWTTQFKPDATKPTAFDGSAGTRTIDMMRRTGTMRYHEDSRMQVVDLPYGNGRYSMTVVLPAPGVSVDDISSSLTPATWSAWTGGLADTEVDLGLPKFRLEYKEILNSALQSMGMGIAFSGSADFSRMSEAFRLAISRVIHKTFIDVNEEGTEAAAVTAVEMRNTSVGDQKRMIVNRPFILAIREHHTGSVIFIGKICDIQP